MKNTIIINRAGFNLATNSTITESGFIDKWMPIVWGNLPGDKRRMALSEAYKVIREAAGIEPQIESDDAGEHAPPDHPESDSITEAE